MFWFAFFIGFIGSLHCLGMCGPIVLALPYSHSSKWNKAIGLVLYQSGRLVSYTLIGLVFGLIGQGASLWGMQQSLSIIMGSLIILYFLFPSKHTLLEDRFLGWALRPLKKNISKLLSIKYSVGHLFIGFLNGFLPCGLVYIAAAGAANTGSPLNAGIFMVGFALGTWPAMILFGASSNWLKIKYRVKIKQILPKIALVMGLLLVIRGLSLGIPYLSPTINPTGNPDQITNCQP